jgi:hypothetical protein
VVTGQADDGTVRLWVMDVTNWSKPVVLGQLATSVAVTSDREYPRVALTPNGALAILAMGTSGLWVVDVSTPTAPFLRGSLSLGGTAWGVGVNATGTVAYVATGDRGLKIVSLSNPAAPTLLATALPTGRYYRDVAVVGTLAFLANQNSTLDVFDVSVATSPVGIGARSFSGFGLRIAAEGSMAVMLSASSTGDQLQVFDVSTPANPVLLRTIALGVPGTGRGVGMNNGMAYVAANDDGLRIYNVQTSVMPGAVPNDFLPRSVSVRGSKSVVLGTYLPTNQLRLKVLDVSVADTPVIRGQLPTTVTATSSMGVALTPNGSLAVAAMGSAGLWVVDVSTPTAPVLRGTLALGGTAWGVAVNSTGSVAYVANGDLGLKIVSLANPAAPTLLATKLPTGRFYRDVAVVGTLAYLANQNGTLDVFDVTTATNPLGIGARSLSSFAVHVAADGPLVTVLSSTSVGDQIQVLDASVPTNPVLLSTTAVGGPGTGQGIAVSNGRACVAAMSEGLKIYDLANPSSPALRSSGTTVGDAYAVALQSGYPYAYVGDFPATLSITGW